MQKESVIGLHSHARKTVERLKKQAKTLQRSGAGKHYDLLNRVAMQAGYDHWHHVAKSVYALGLHPHHALVDARALRAGFRAYKNR